MVRSIDPVTQGTPWDPVAHAAAVLIGPCVANAILARGPTDRIRGRTYGCNRSSPDHILKPCEQGAVHIWVPDHPPLRDRRPG